MKPHLVPLSRQALKLLDGVREASAAVSSRTRTDGSNSPLGKRGGQVGPRTLFAVRRQQLRQTSGPNLTSFRFCWGIRTWAGNYRFIPKSRYRREHAEALQRLADQVDAIAHDGSNLSSLSCHPCAQTRRHRPSRQPLITGEFGVCRTHGQGALGEPGSEGGQDRAVYTGRSPLATTRVRLSTPGSISAGSRVTMTSMTVGDDRFSRPSRSALSS
jgi:hypothetical protein